MEDEDTAFLYETLPRRTVLHPQRSSHLLDIIEALLLVGLGAILASVLILLRHGSHLSPVDQLYSGDEVSVEDIFPMFPTLVKELSVEDEFWRIDSIGQQAWDTLVPNGAGYIRVRHPRRYGLNTSQPSAQDSESEVYQAAVIHQLHCLATIREAFVKYEGDGKTFSYDRHHVFHCFDYLRQIILCAGDITLDAGVPLNRLEDNIHGYVYDGMNAQYTCKDWNTVKSFLATHADVDRVVPLLET